MTVIKKYITLSSLLVLSLFLYYLACIQIVHANTYPKDKFSFIPKATPTPEPHQSCKDKPKPTPTDTPLSVTSLDCDGDTDGGNPNSDDSACITPTITSIPTTQEATVSATTSPIQDNSSTPDNSNNNNSSNNNNNSDASSAIAHINLCNGIYPDKPIIRQDLYQKTGSTSAHFAFWPVNADSYIVEYGYSLNNLPYGIPYLPSTSTGFDINKLNPGFTFLYAKVTAKLGECYTSSDIGN